jgi:hypothetical protein
VAGGVELTGQVNRTVIFVTFASLAAIGIVGSVVLQLFRPDASATFTNLLVTVLGLSATAAGTFYGLGKANERLETVVKNTNGTLSAKDEEIQRLHREKEQLLAALAAQQEREEITDGRP